jgi:lysozyme
VVQGVTPLGLARLQLDEGERLALYDDKTGLSVGTLPSGGWPTIGYGRNLVTDPLTSTEALYLFSSSVTAIEAALNRDYPWLAGRFNTIPVDVLTMVQYNTGKLAQFVRMLAACQASNWPTMALELMDSAAARELPARYMRMRTALLDGAWEAEP